LQPDLLVTLAPSAAELPRSADLPGCVLLKFGANPQEVKDGIALAVNALLDAVDLSQVRLSHMGMVGGDHRIIHDQNWLRSRILPRVGDPMIFSHTHTHTHTHTDAGDNGIDHNQN
jgi:hypothetical protein